MTTKTHPALPPAGTPITRDHVTAYAATLIANRWHDTAELITRMADQIWPRKYGSRNIVNMYRDIEALRQLIRSEGSPAIQAALDRVEPCIDFAYRNLERAA